MLPVRNETKERRKRTKGTRDKWKGLGPNDDSRPPLEWNGMEKDRKREKKKEKKEKKQRLFLFFVAKKYFQRMKLILVVY